MSPKQIKQFNEMHKKINFLVDEIKVNGRNGTKPLIGIQNILEGHQNQYYLLNDKVEQLQCITAPLNKNKEARLAFVTLVHYMSTNVKFWLVISAGILGWIGLNNLAKIVAFFKSII
jgi:hypothetical protein